MSGLPRKKCTPKRASSNRAEHKTVQTRHDKTKQKYKYGKQNKSTCTQILALCKITLRCCKRSRPVPELMNRIHNRTPCHLLSLCSRWEHHEVRQEFHLSLCRRQRHGRGQAREPPPEGGARNQRCSERAAVRGRRHVRRCEWCVDCRRVFRGFTIMNFRWTIGFFENFNPLTPLPPPTSLYSNENVRTKTQPE